MVSNQVLARADVGRDSGRSAARLGLAAGGLALVLASGCASFHREDGTVAAGAPQHVAAATTQEKPPLSAVDAAIARGDSTTVVVGPGTSTDASQPVVLNPNAPKSYTVKRGDTLWGIASVFLRDPWLWPEIWYANPSIENPHLIYPGDVLTLAFGADGKPQIQVTRGNGAGDTISATRVEPLIRSAPIDAAIPTIPYGAIAAFLGRPSLIPIADARTAPHVVAMQELHVAVGTPNEIYVQGSKPLPPGRYSVVRLAEPMKDPATHKVLGYMGVYTGTARIDETTPVSRAYLVDSARETIAGDVLFNEEPQITTDLQPHPAPSSINGQIMAVVDGVSMIGQYQVVAINRGSRHGLVPGHVLTIEKPGEVVNDSTCAARGIAWCFGQGPKVHLPTERIGTLLVFKTYDELSYALTVSVTAPVRIADRVRGP